MRVYYTTKAPSSRIRIFFNPELFLSGFNGVGCK